MYKLVAQPLQNLSRHASSGTARDIVVTELAGEHILRQTRRVFKLQETAEVTVYVKLAITDEPQPLPLADVTKLMKLWLNGTECEFSLDNLHDETKGLTGTLKHFVFSADISSEDIGEPGTQRRYRHDTDCFNSWCRGPAYDAEISYANKTEATSVCADLHGRSEEVLYKRQNSKAGNAHKLPIPVHNIARKHVDKVMARCKPHDDHQGAMYTHLHPNYNTRLEEVAFALTYNETLKDRPDLLHTLTKTAFRQYLHK